MCFVLGGNLIYCTRSRQNAAYNLLGETLACARIAPLAFVCNEKIGIFPPLLIDKEDLMETTNKRLQFESVQFRAFTIVIAIIAFISNVVEWLPKDILSDGFNYWSYTDWLIDYSTGFTRRGLGGELVGLIANYYDPHVFVVGLVWGIFIVFAFGFFILCFRSIHLINNLGFVAVLFLPSLFFFYLYDHAPVSRKEIFGYIVLFLHIILVEQYYKKIKNGSGNRKQALNHYLRHTFFVLGVLVSIHILTHEAAFFLFVPVHILISWTILMSSEEKACRNFKKQMMLLLILYAPIFLIFGIVTFFGRPSIDAVRNICQNWAMIGEVNMEFCLSSEALPGAFGTLHWGFYEAASLTWWHYGHVVVSLFLVFLTFGIINFYFVSKATVSIYNSLHARQKIVAKAGMVRWSAFLLGIKYYLLPAFATLPLYLFGIDYGRWFAVISINYVIVTLSARLLVLEYENHSSFAFGDRVKTCIDNICVNQPIVLTKHIYLWGFLNWILLLLIIFFTRLPHCCSSSMENFFKIPF